MSKITTVAINEYLKAVRSKAFLAGLILMPVMFGAGAIAMAVAENTKDLSERSFAVIDRSGELLPVLEEALAQRNEQGLYDEEGAQVEPRWQLVEPVPADPDERLDLTLSRQVEEGELQGFLTIGADVVDPQGSDGELSWSTDTPTADDIPDWLGGVVNDAVRGRRFAEAGLDRQLVERLTGRVRLRTLGLVTVDESGEIVEGEESNELAEVLVPIVLVMMMFMLVMMSAPALLNNVLEEKMQKIVEVLVSSVSPFELLLGKLLSAVAMSLTLALLYVGAGLVFVHRFEGVPEPIIQAITPGLLTWFVVFKLLALVIYGSMFSAIGAACSEIQDSQTLMMPAMLLFMLPMMFLGPVIQNPTGGLAMGLSWFPPTAPIILFLRMAMPPGVPWWELALALTTTLAFTLAAVWAGAKVFRIGILSSGQTPSFKTLIGWVLTRQ